MKAVHAIYVDGKRFEVGNSDMQRILDVLLGTVDGEKEHTFSHYGGAAAAYERVAKHIFQKSAELFLDGDDEEARCFRKLAEEIKEWGDITRTEQKRYK